MESPSLPRPADEGVPPDAPAEQAGKKKSTVSDRLRVQLSLHHSVNRRLQVFRVTIEGDDRK